MKKTCYRVLLINSGISFPDHILPLDSICDYIVAHNVDEALHILAKQKIDLVIVEEGEFFFLDGGMNRSRLWSDRNLLKILVSGPDTKKAHELEKEGRIFHFLERPFSRKELKLTLDMAFKSLKILSEKIELVDKLKRKAKTLLNQRRQLSDTLECLKEANLNSIKVLAEAIEAKDPYTRGHCNRVSRLAKEIALHLGYDNKMIARLVLGAFLHDIGKIGVRGAVLNKDAKLNEAEKEHVKSHTLIGVNIVKPVRWCHKFIPMIRSHHERVDGKGYPDGLKGKDIPMDARILGVADAFDAMTSKRPYREALVLNEALRRMKLADGTQFDPELLKIFFDNKIFENDFSKVKGVSFSLEDKEYEKEAS